MNTLPKVAMLEPDRLVRELIAKALEGEGIAVVGIFEDEASLCSSLRRHPPDAVLLSVEGVSALPRLISKIVQLHPSIRPVVLAEGDSKLQEQCLRRGAEFFVRSSTSWEPVLRAITGRKPRGNPRRRYQDVVLRKLISERELEVLSYVATGMDNLKIAMHLGISEHTVKVHVSRLYQKLGQENRTQLALFARESGVAPAIEL